MASIYNDQHLELYDLLSRASNDQGATLLIPDLQRPFVWTPRQVILLLDSLIRGWPFGTFLTWKVKKDDPVRELARPFWKLVDRTQDEDGEKVSKKNPPGSFQMVLDGQQRIQSLLLAVCGDSWGFKLYDRDWTTALTDEKPRGRQGIKHWSVGCLCVDLDMLMSGYARTRKTFGLDFGTILKWAVTGGKEAQSEFEKKANYVEPLPRLQDASTKGRLIRFSRLWDSAPAQDGIEQDQAESIAESLLKEHDVQADRLADATKAVGSLLLNLSRVKRVRITFLELAEFDERLVSREEYNDAVVNIFTRLNTAGRTLTREDITFAWLKIGWLQDKTGNRSAAECFSDLGKKLAEEQLDLSTEDLVAGVSFVWSVAHAKGRVLTNKDLLRGETIRPMAKDVSEHWNTLLVALADASSIVSDRGLVYGTNYQSLNSLYVSWAWMYIARVWLSKNPLPTVARDSYSKKVTEAFSTAIDQWLICSQWAGRWASSLVETVAGYAGRLAICHDTISGKTNQDDVVDVLCKFLDDEIGALKEDAIKGVQTIGVLRREQVSTYFTPLWLWHRLDSERWQKSKIQLRTAKNRRMLHDVDHTVAHSLWEKKIETDMPDGISDKESALTIVNKLGNCALLEKTFNISKSAKTLESFIEDVHELKTGAVSLADWSAALAIPNPMLDPNKVTSSVVAAAIEERDSKIREDLIAFIKGTKQRVDLEVV